MSIIPHIVLRLILGFTVVYAQRNQLTLTHVASCGKGGINVQRFGFTYHRWSRVLEYDFVGSATTPGVFSEILVDVTTYGRKAPTQKIELCSATDCPISENIIQANGSQILSASYANDIPDVVWTIPDVDAVATLTFRNVTELACLVASMSNGITTQTSSVSWVTGGVTLGIIIVSGIISAAGTLGSSANPAAGPAGSPSPVLGSGVTSSAPMGSGVSHASVLGSSSASMGSGAPPMGSGPASAASHSASVAGSGSDFMWSASHAGPVPVGSVAPPAPGQGPGFAPAPQVHPTSPWAASNILAPVSPASAHLPFPPGASRLAYPGVGETFALGAAGVMLAASGGAMATTTAANSGSNGNVIQRNGHDETTVRSSHSPFGRMDPIILFLHFQSISSSGLLSLRYPTIYQAFTVNFAWANFILPITAFKKAASHLGKCALPDMQSNSSGTRESSSAVPSVSYGPPLATQTGIDAYATRLGIPSQDIFGITYLVFLCACGILLVIFVVIGIVLQIVVWVSPGERKGVWELRRFRWAEMASNNSLRIIVLALGTLSTFAFYQWTQHCATGLAFFLSASALAVILLNLWIVCFLIFHISNRPGGTALLFSNKTSYGRRWGTLYDSLNETRLFFVVPLLFVVLARSAVVGFGQGHGLVQVVVLTALETIIAINLFYWRPYYNQGYNLINCLLQIMKVISHVLLIFFVPSFNFNLIGSTVIGIALLVLNSIVALVLVTLTILKIGWGVLWYRSKHHGFESRKDRYKRQSRAEED